MQKYIVTVFLLIFYVNPAVGQSPESTKAVADEIKCFAAKDMAACLNVITGSYSFPTQLRVSWFACEAKNAGACNKLLGYFENPDQVFTTEEKTRGLALSSSVLAECASGELACSNLRQSYARLRASLDPNAAECRLEVYNLGPLTDPQVSQKKTPLGRFVEPSECASQCLLFTGREVKDGRKYVRCMFKDKSIEALKLFGFETPRGCDDKPFDPGENIYFQACYCWGRSHPAVNEMAFDYGVIAEGTAGTGRRFLKQTAYRCAIEFRRIEKESAKDPACAKKFVEFKTKINARRDLKPFELNFKNMECAKTL